MQALASFACCCTPADEGTHVHLVDTTNAAESNSEYHLAGSLQRTAEPNFKGRLSEVSSSSKAGPGGRPQGSRSKEMEKVRLQEIVKEFSKEAMTGIRVNLISAETSELFDTTLLMDRYLYTLTLRPAGGAERRHNMKDLSSIYKGPDFTQKIPSLAHLAPHCVGLDFSGGPPTLFHFNDPVQRDQFYTCLKILRMSVDINNARTAAKAGVGAV
mmetsp:Transcript_104203/g.261295  ORF Transcript_104203/g.261295 Transcript_104203/m.261295 type:complete len:214 (-) Transcript_104203:22-663(-)|eukprot:CAMPEP_0115264436 /NCGR_PEP_ID=MMETSP0270-20121206/50428_1 /TAXON_ID=71861 /ORGANISM="Scrippsiella trochoidea, Strain CCMP3099" /LENGTH=213 /DNA_ID=CAMNT_0002680455 /DNA_START=96 /DNA_END=737 /DNA_ORIENTATION=-